MNINKPLILSALFVFLWGIACEAQDITVRKSGAEHFLLNLSGFKNIDEEESTRLFLTTLESNLTRSGWFTLTQAGHADFVITGEVEQRGSSLRTRYEANSQTGTRLLSKRDNAEASDARHLAHRIADEIVFALTGRKGMANSQIVMVGTLTGHKELYVCDADGGNLRQLTDDKTVSVGPKWGPDGKQLVYTSYRSRFPDVYLIDIKTGSRKYIARYPGLNACAAISPDGKKVALTLSKDGNPDLFIIELTSERLTRLTSMKRAAQASPSWAPDGKRIVFVSDVDGSPQLYMIDSAGGAPRRITSRGSENVEPEWGSNGLIVYSSRIAGRYVISVLNPETLETRQISKADADYSSPSWAPDGRHIVCERRHANRSRIFIIDSTSSSSISLFPETLKGEWLSPNWSKQ